MTNFLSSTCQNIAARPLLILIRLWEHTKPDSVLVQSLGSLILLAASSGEDLLVVAGKLERAGEQGGASRVAALGADDLPAELVLRIASFDEDVLRLWETVLLGPLHKKLLLLRALLLLGRVP